MRADRVPTQTVPLPSRPTSSVELTTEPLRSATVQTEALTQTHLFTEHSAVQTYAAAAEAPQALAFADIQSAPDLKAVAKGAQLQAGQQGEAVVQLRELLHKAGYPAGSGNHFDDKLKAVVSRFQADRQLASPGSVHSGLVGPQTLQSLQQGNRWGGYHPQLGLNLANHARRHVSGGVGRCYEFVANAIDSQVKRFLSGGHAYMAAPQLARSPHFQEVRASGSELRNLPAGAVVVWAKGHSDSGHISIADGRGNEISDHIGPQMTRHYGGGAPRVFVPTKRN